MALEGEIEVSLPGDGASDAVSPQPEQESVGGVVREAYERAKETAEAAGDPEKLEQIRVRRGKEGRFERGEGNDTRSATGERQKAPEAKETPATEKPAVAAQETPVQADVSAPLTLRPPPGWSAQARADYAKLPLHVQQAVAQREVEVNKGFEKLKDFAGMEEFLPTIKASNTTAAAVMKNAFEWERSLKTNPVHTIMHAAKQGRVDMVALARQIIQGQGQPAQRQQSQPGQQQRPPDVSSLVAQEFAKRERAAAQQKATSEAETFLADPKNVHAEAVIDDMVALIEKGRAKGLPDAYEKAIWANPEIRAELIKQHRTPPSNGNPRQAVNQARSAAKTTLGAPSGPLPGLKAAGPPKTVRDAVRQAYAVAQDAD